MEIEGKGKKVLVLSIVKVLLLLFLKGNGDCSDINYTFYVTWTA